MLCTVGCCSVLDGIIHLFAGNLALFAKACGQKRSFVTREHLIHGITQQPSPWNSLVSYCTYHASGVITLWSLDTITLLFTLLLPRPRQHPLSSTPSSLPRPLKSMTMPLALTFLAQSGRILACGDSYAAVWDLLSEEVKTRVRLRPPK